MTARQVHAVIAAGLEDPSRVARWASEPERLRRQGVDPESLDLAALHKFSGLTVKVRHNGLRQDFPLTFRLLNVAGLEIEVFSAYAALRPSLAPAPAERARDLIAFLETWLDRTRREHVLLWDLIRHEHAISRLRRMAPGEEVPAGVPRIRGAIVLHEMQCDPRVAASVLHQSRPPLGDIPLERRYVCYWRPAGEAGLRVVELDAFGYSALALVDGIRSVADISEAMGGKRRPSRLFLRLLGQLGEAGIIQLGRP